MADPTKKRAPAYPWYPRDFDMDEEVKLMTYEEEGIYRRLLDHQWFHESIPADVDLIARLVPKVPVTRFRKLWPVMSTKFAPVDGRLVNQKLERVRAEKDDFHEGKRRAGKASVEARRQQNGSAQPNKHPNSAPNTLSNTVRTEDRTDARTGLEPAFASASATDEVKNTSSAPPTPNTPNTGPTPERRIGNRRGGPERTLPKIFLHSWQEERLVEALGVHAEPFAIDEWLSGLSRRAYADGLTFPNRDATWDWIQAEFEAEIRRRGLPVAGPSVVAAAPSRPTHCKHQPACANEAEHTRRDIEDRRRIPA